MFKSNAIFHTVIMLVLEFIMCYGLSYGLVSLFTPAYGTMRSYSLEGNDKHINYYLQLAGNDYIQAYNRMDEDKQYDFRHNVREMAINYEFGEKEFKIDVWFLTWALYCAAMVFFLCYLVVVSESRDLIAAPPLCKILGLFLLLLPLSVLTEPLSTRKERKRAKIDNVINGFSKYRKV